MEIVGKTPFKCSTSTDANKLAEGIYLWHKENPNSGNLSIRVIGAGALNQAIKAIIISNKFFSKNGLLVTVSPSFQESKEGVTAIDLRVIITNIG